MSPAPDPIPLVELVRATAGAELDRGDPTTPITDVTHDSRRVQPGALFVAIPGFEHDGATFVPDAVARGAAAIASQGPLQVEVPLVHVASARQALADLAAAFYRYPSRAMPVVGITGTDGKTSTTHLLSAILEAHGLRTGWLTTVNTRIGDHLRPNAVDQTTPEAPIVQRTLAEMREAGVRVAILETSSHALELDRVRGTQFQVGIFTNLSPEHINFHGSFEAYRAAKARLFSMLPRHGLAILNADDAATPTMRQATAARVVTYALDAPAEFRARDIQLSTRGTRFVVEPGDIAVTSHLVGRFNVANWLAAYAAATTAFGATPDDLQRATASQPPVPGRMNLVDQGQPFAVVVDFAHTPQALEKALSTIRTLGARRVLLVFGLAGGRDAANRPVMGALATRLADVFVISTDDPGDEDPASIAQQIAHGAGQTATYEIELDRRAAIQRVLSLAQPGDAVLLAGKGHEQRMVVRGQRLPWNDAQVAREELDRLGYGPAPA